MLGEAEEKGIVSLNQPIATEMEGHICTICGGPDHQACGCEAKATAAKPEQPALKMKMFGQLQKPALKIEPPAANIAEAVRAATKADIYEKIEATDKALSQIIENRDAMLTTQRDLVEQLKRIGDLMQLIINRRTNGTSLN
jgi:hypothetical protein